MMHVAQPPGNLQDALSDAVLIVAHPDDEILWFGSVVADVASIVLCFSEDPAHPNLTEARRKCLAEHPYRDRIVNLGLQETRAFNKADWPNPEPAAAGLRISRSNEIRLAYEECAARLREALREIDGPVKNVFTHNPWGEYGHEEHVLVSKAASDFAEQRDAAIWYDNYASNWSLPLMLRHLDTTGRQLLSAPVPVAQMQVIADIYRKHDAWTWLDDFQWFANDHFLRGPLPAGENFPPGALMPVNLVRLKPRHKPAVPRPPSLTGRVIRKLSRLAGLQRNETAKSGRQQS